MQNKLQTRGLIQIISQLPDNSIIKLIIKVLGMIMSLT